MRDYVLALGRNARLCRLMLRGYVRACDHGCVNGHESAHVNDHADDGRARESDGDAHHDLSRYLQLLLHRGCNRNLYT